MTTSDVAQFPLGVSLHTLDHEQPLDTIKLLGGSSVKAVELWEPTFRKDEKHWLPLRGVIDWVAVWAALSAVDFSGPFLYEASLDGETPAERLALLEANFLQLHERCAVAP